MKTETLPSPSQTDALIRLRDLVEEIRIAMLTTVATDGTLRSRPMATLQVDAAASALWFLTADDSPKVEEMVDEQQVNLAYASPAKQSYVSVTGRARILHDREKVRELWTPMAKIWFPEGVDDPRIALLRVEVESAEYWDSPSNKMVRLYGRAKLALTGKPPKLGENVKVELPESRPPW